MTYEPPNPPADLSTEVVNTLGEFAPDHLRDIAQYAEALAEHKERKNRLDEETNEGDVKDRPEDLPDDVPTKASITIKEINGNRYYYWQWRDGDKIRSKYKGPVGSEN